MNKTNTKNSTKLNSNMYHWILNAINYPESLTPSFYDDVSFEDIVIVRKELIDFEIMYQSSEFIHSRNNLIKLMNKLIIERVKEIDLEGNK